MNNFDDIVILDQLIYTRVEAEYSPRGKSGFQIVYQSRLSQDIVNTIEHRVRCFDTSQQQFARLQFFTVGDHVVLTHTVSIPTDPNIVDQSCRPGAFLTHCLILDIADFEEKLQNDPFILFDNFDFVESALEMVERFGKLSVFIPPISWKNPKEHKSIFFIDTRSTVSLALYLLSFELSKSMTFPVLLQAGPSKEIGLLRLLFKLLPYDKRQTCSFDTQINCCMFQASWYKIICGDPANSNSRVKYITLSQVVAKKYATGDLESIYAQWLSYISKLDELTRENIFNFIQRAATIQQVDVTWRKRGICDLAVLSEQASQEIRDARYALIKEILKNRLSAMLNQKLSYLIMPYILKTNSIKQLVDVSITQIIDEISLHKALVKFLNEHETELVDEDWLAIKKFSEKTNNMYLLFLASTVISRVDKRMRDRALKQMSKTEYKQLLKNKLKERLGKPVPLVHFVEETHLSVLLHNNNIKFMTDNDILELIDQLIKINAETYTSKFVKRIKDFELESILKLEKIIRRKNNIPNEVILAIKNAKSFARTNAPGRLWHLTYH